MFIFEKQKIHFAVGKPVSCKHFNSVSKNNAKKKRERIFFLHLVEILFHHPVINKNCTYNNKRKYSVNISPPNLSIFSTCVLIFFFFKGGGIVLYRFVVHYNQAREKKTHLSKTGTHEL